MTIFFITVVTILLASLVFLWRSKSALRKKLCLVESNLSKILQNQEFSDRRLSIVEKLQQEKLSQDQIDYRDKLQAQYSLLFEQIQDTFKVEVKATKADAISTVKKCKADFEQLLKTEFEKACEQIKFDEIEYKNTITKKRQEYNRKNSKNAKPQRIWRYINEE